jgi:hypothetical protein
MDNGGLAVIQAGLGIDSRKNTHFCHSILPDLSAPVNIIFF